jgi:rhamnulokinase
LEGLIGSRIEVLHVVGGGSRDALLCQATADACGVEVEAGPAEATSVGNVLMQAMAVGRVGSLGQLREFSRRSSDLRRYRPERTSAWQRQAARFEALAGSSPGR